MDLTGQPARADAAYSRRCAAISRRESAASDATARAGVNAVVQVKRPARGS